MLSPADIGPTAATMNYACVVAAAVWAFATAYYFMPRIGGKTFFRGPCTTEYEESNLHSAFADIAVEAEMSSDGKADSKADRKGSNGTTVQALHVAD